MSISILASWALPIVKALDAYAIDGYELMRRAGLEPVALWEENARYSYEGIRRLWNMAAAASRDSAFGISVAEFWHPSTLHALGFAWMVSATLYDALERLARYARIVNNAVEMNLVDKGAETVLHGRLLADDLPKPADASVNAAAAIIVRMCRISAGEHFAPLRVAFRQEAPPDQQRFRDYFQAAVNFNCSRDELVFATDALHEQLPSGNTALALANEQLVIDYLARFDRSNTAMQVKAKLIEQLPSGHIDQGHIAKQLNTSVRNLQRQLQQEGMGFRQLLEDTRRDLAIGYVSDSSYRLNEIAYLLGFSEPANFTRAFRRWTGRTPTEYRQAS